MPIVKTFVKGKDNPVLRDETNGIDRFYKYRAINEQNLAILRNRKIYFSKAEMFNDPFDIDVPVRFDLMSNQEFDDMSIAVIQEASGLTKEQATNHFVTNVKPRADFGNAHYRSQMRDSQMRKLKESCSIFCLSTKNDDVLMWSHYANCHTGMCIGFNHNVIYNNTGVAFGRVKYHSAYPQFIPNDKLENYYIGQILSKANPWEYEAEFRFIDLRGRNTFEIEPTAIEQVIVGCCVSYKDLATIKDILRSDAALNHVELLRAEKVPYQYKLEVRPL